MRIKLDENVTIAAQPVLIKHGHDVHTVHNEDLIGAPDSDLLAVCRDEVDVSLSRPPGSDHPQGHR